MKHWLIALFLILMLTTGVLSCGDDDDDDDDSGDDDSVDDDDDSVDDDDATDDDDDDDNDDDNDDDTVFADDYVAPWPQSALEPQTYDESGIAGPLREKAMDYDDWHRTWHQPDHGGCVHVYFTDASQTEVARYHGWGDSAIWTGTYAASESYRHYITGEALAKQIVIEKIEALDGMLHVTGRPGFIARYWGSQSLLDMYGGPNWCDNDPRCNKVDTGDYAGDFWHGGTSRDQYTGWFYGMAMAYDLVDDPDMRDMIIEDVAEVLDELIANSWWIIDEAGFPTDAGPNVLPGFQLAWITIGYHITGLDRFKEELAEQLMNANRLWFKLNHISFFNRYSSYYGNNLSHTNWYNILRLGREYYSPDDYEFMVSVFEKQVHSFTRLSHNPWFNSIFMGQGDYDPSDPDYLDQLHEDLTTFQDAPLAEFYVPAKDPSTYTLDPISVFLADLGVQYPFLEQVLGNFKYQATEPFGVDGYCPAGFMFQWSPFTIDECGSDDPTKVHSGHDYLAPYWLASYHQFVTKED
jgi:hypothetical protein